MKLGTATVGGRQGGLPEPLHRIKDGRRIPGASKMRGRVEIQPNGDRSDFLVVVGGGGAIVVLGVPGPQVRVIQEQRRRAVDIARVGVVPVRRDEVKRLAEMRQRVVDKIDQISCPLVRLRADPDGLVAGHELCLQFLEGVDAFRGILARALRLPLLDVLERVIFGRNVGAVRESMPISRPEHSGEVQRYHRSGWGGWQQELFVAEGEGGRVSSVLHQRHFVEFVHGTQKQHHQNNPQPFDSDL